MGRRDAVAASHAGWTALSLGVGFMVSAAAILLIMPGVLVRLFTGDAHVVGVGTSLLFVAAMFQVFDGLQGVATGVLRGAGDTKTAMLTNLGAHWGLGLPIGYSLCFLLGWGVIGLWIGLSLSLVIVGLVLLTAWSTRVHAIREEFGS
jgi:MATE family multidrug resistance protein